MGDEKKTGVDPGMGWWRTVLWLVVLLVGFMLLAHITNTLLVFGLAWLIAYLLNPVVDLLEGQKLGPVKELKRGVAISLVYLILIGALLAVAALLFPQVSHQMEKVLALQSTLDDPIELRFRIQEKIDFLMDKLRLPTETRDQLFKRAAELVQDSTSKIGSWVGKAFQYLAAFIGQMVSGLFLFITALIVSIYMLQNWHDSGDVFVEWLPYDYQDDARALGLKMNEIFGGYLKATIITSLACGVATLVALWILSTIWGAHFPYIFLIAFIAGMTYPIPILGIIGTSIVGGVLGFLPENDLGFAVAVFVVINVVNSIIDRTVQPKLMSDAIGVSELFVMFAAFAGGELMGIWGMLLGIPVAAMAKTLFVWFHGRFLVDQPEPVPPPEEPRSKKADRKKKKPAKKEAPEPSPTEPAV
ncbi:MAG: AI-2E family transporter [Vulcanimicrobiota bacterium]